MTINLHLKSYQTRLIFQHTYNQSANQSQKVEVKALKTERGKNEPRNRFRPGCRSCREKGWGSSCRHCFRCGNIGHLSRDCDLNDQGLVLIGDHQ